MILRGGSDNVAKSEIACNRTALPCEADIAPMSLMGNSHLICGGINDVLFACTPGTVGR
jgi:hypothetical protein